MPWHIESENPDCSGFAVVKDDDGEIEGCHDTKDEAQAQLAALYANEEHAMSLPAAPPPAEGYRALSYPSEYRDDAGRPPRLVGHFARYNTFNEIDSAIEGRFMERIVPGAFARTFKNNRDRIRVLFQHGKDPSVGEKPIAAIQELRSDDVGPYYEAELLDGIHPLVLDGLRKGQYGVSYRFQVINEDWDPKPAKGPHNPKGLPERTIREARVFEFGPVTFPADAGADVAVRSLSDQMRSPSSEPVAPSPEPEAPAPHPEPEARDVPVVIEPEKKESVRMDISQYRTLDEMGARVRELDAEIKRAAELPGLLPEKEQAEFDAKVAERAELEHAMTAWRNRLTQVRVVSENPGNIFTPIAHIVRRTETDIYDIEDIERRSRSAEERAQAYRDNAMRAAEQLRTTDERCDQDKSRERLAALLDNNDSADKEIAKHVLRTGSPQYRQAFHRYLTTVGNERGTALAVGVDGTGGYSVPVQFDPTVVAIGAWTAINPYRQSCRQVTISGTDTWQALTSTAVVAAYAAEADAAAEQGPTFARPEYIAKRAQGQITTSHEMLQDRPDLVSEMSVLIAEAKDTLEEAQFTTGVGTTVYPQGIGLKDAFTRVDSVTNDTVAVADVLAVEAALPIRHRLNAAWYLTRKAIRAIQAWETTGGQLFNGTGYPAVGNPVARPGGNTGLTLLGYPVWETPSMPWTPTTDDTTWGVLMDPRNYVIVDRVGLSVRVIPDLINSSALATGQAAIYFSFRNTARVLNVDGGRQGAVQ